MKMKFDRSRKWCTWGSNWLPAVEIGGMVETSSDKWEKIDKAKWGFEIMGSKWQSTREKPTKRKKKKGRNGGVTTWNLRAKCKCSGKRQRVMSVRFVWQFIFIAPFRSLDSTLSLAVFLFLYLLYLIISRRCAIVPQFVYLATYLAACLFALLQPAEPIYRNVRESSTEN